MAGPVITFGSVSRQRCSWCGALIDEKDMTRIAVQIPEDGSDPLPLAWWEVGGLVAVSGSNPRVSSAVEPELSEDETMPDGSPVYKAPERSCMRLFEGLESSV